MIHGEQTLGERKLRRFLVGPKECEIAGIPKRRTARQSSSTSSIQAKSRLPTSPRGRSGVTGPNGGLSRPRSATNRNPYFGGVTSSPGFYSSWLRRRPERIERIQTRSHNVA